MAIYCSQCGIENQPEWQFCMQCGTRLLPRIGNIEPVCPYCQGALKKKPGKKAKCPGCGNFIYVRTRPSDNQQALVTEAQAELIREQWAIVNGIHDQYLAERRDFDKQKARLEKQANAPASNNDVRWAILNRQRLENASSGHWGLYRNATFEMAEILRKERRFEQALSKYLEVCYLDINGPQNNCRDLGIAPFTPEKAPLAFGVVSATSRLIGDLSLDGEQVWQIFSEMAEINHRALRLPVSPWGAWGFLKQELFED